MKPIPGYPGYCADLNGDVYSTRMGAPHRMSARLHLGYMHVVVRCGIGRDTKVKMPLHQLIALAFHGPKPTAAHVAMFKDGDARNARPDNIEWSTRVDVVAGQMSRGSAACLRRGESSNSAKLSDDDVRSIRSLIRNGSSQSSAARAFGITPTHARQIGQGITRREAGGTPLSLGL